MAAERTRTIDVSQAQLFIDDTWIADSARVGRVFHQPRKYPEPVLRGDRSWEEKGLCIYGTALKRGDLFQMWYMTWTRNSQCKVCYAKSPNGVDWDKPSLGIHEFDGPKDNNICLVGEQGGGIDNISVIDDPADPEWPLKAILWQSGPRRGLAAVRSKDGVHWDWTPGLVLPGWGDRTNAIPNRVDGKYVILGRAPGMMSKYGMRLVARTESKNLVHWSEPKLMLKADVEDPAQLQFYSATAFRYESLYLGFIERMYVTPDKLDSELIHSHDSRNWDRPRPRTPFIPWGAPGSWDATWLSIGSGGPIWNQGRLWFYYSGRSGAHGVPYPLNHAGVGLATLRLDGFASLQAKEKPGWVETPPLRWPGGDLLVNVDPRRDLTAHPSSCSGEVRVEVRGLGGRPLKGHGAEECISVARNTGAGRTCESCRRVPVQWRNQPRGMKKHKGKVVRLIFHLQDAHLYSFAAGE